MIISSKIDGLKVDNQLITLTHATFEISLFEPNIIEKKSVINGDRKYKKISDDMFFSILIYLYKYNEVEKRNIFETFNTIKNKNVEVIFSNDSKIYAFAYDIKNYFLSNLIFYDLMKIKLINLANVTISKYILTKSGEKIKTKDGKYLRTRGIII